MRLLRPVRKCIRAQSRVSCAPVRSGKYVTRAHGAPHSDLARPLHDGGGHRRVEDERGEQWGDLLRDPAAADRRAWPDDPGMAARWLHEGHPALLGIAPAGGVGECPFCPGSRRSCCQRSRLRSDHPPDGTGATREGLASPPGISCSCAIDAGSRGSFTGSGYNRLTGPRPTYISGGGDRAASTFNPDPRHET